MKYPVCVQFCTRVYRHKVSYCLHLSYETERSDCESEASDEEDACAPFFKNLSQVVITWIVVKHNTVKSPIEALGL